MLRAALMAAALCMSAFPVSAQRPDPLARAEQLLRSGRLFAAESVYYWAVTSRPRDPEARLALGGYLAARGALRPAATLYEEARFFGGDARTVATHLAPLYELMGEYASLSTLPGSPLSVAEQRRAEWLRDNRPTRRGPAAVTVPWRRVAPEPIGSIVLRLGNDSIVAHIDPRARGLTLDAAVAGRRGVTVFNTASERGAERLVAVVRELRIGEVVLGNVPATLVSSGDATRAVVGLDFLARLAPTFDEQASTVTLRIAGKASPVAGARSYPTFVRGGDLLLVDGRALHSLLGTDGRALVDGRRWTVRPGEILVH